MAMRAGVGGQSRVCSWPVEGHCYRFHVSAGSRFLFALGGAVAMFLILVGRAVLETGWNTYWADPAMWRFDFFYYGTFCVLGWLVSMNLSESAGWKHVASAMGLPAVLIAIAALGQAVYARVILG